MDGKHLYIYQRGQKLIARLLEKHSLTDWCNNVSAKTFTVPIRFWRRKSRRYFFSHAWQLSQHKLEFRTWQFWWQFGLRKTKVSFIFSRCDLGRKLSILWQMWRFGVVSQECCEMIFRVLINFDSDVCRKKCATQVSDSTWSGRLFDIKFLLSFQRKQYQSHALCKAQSS